jgi:putative transcriptional regulator
VYPDGGGGGILDVEDELSTKIAGEISLSEDPSKVMKKWREIFGLTQSELARYLHTTPSVVSDYESGRRRSPGTTTVRKFVGAVIRYDADRGHPIIKSYQKAHLHEMKQDIIIDMQEFRSPLSTEKLCEVIRGEIVANEEYSDIRIYGYTIVDSIKAILEFSSDEFLSLYGTTSQRALIFTKVSYGRSPLIAVRVSSIKPRIVVMHGVERIDDLGLKIAKKERIPVILTVMNQDEMLKELRRYAV